MSRGFVFLAFNRCPSSCIRETFERAGFGELAFEDSPPFGIGANQLLAPPLPFANGVRLFEFVGYDVLQPDFTQASVELERRAEAHD